MHYLLPCSCGQKIRVAPSQAGGLAPCSCGRSLAIPTLRGIRQLEPAQEQAARPAAAWTAVHGAFFSGGLALATVGVVIIAWCTYQYALIGGLAVDRSGAVIQHISAQIDSFTPAQSLDVWTEEVLAEGLGEPHQPIWVRAKEKVAEFFWWIKFGAAAIVGGLAVAAATWGVSRAR